MRSFNENGKYARHTGYAEIKRKCLFSGINRMDPANIVPQAYVGSPKAVVGTGGFKITRKTK